jgi:hypothetical protein
VADAVFFWRFGAAETITIDNISVNALPGNHATQATSTSRPVLSARVNLLTKTEQFDDAVWTKVQGTITATELAAPNGTTTAGLFTVTTAGVPAFFQTVTVAASTAYTFSGYVQAGNQTTASVELRFSAGDNSLADAIFSLSGSGSVTLTDTDVTASIESVGSGWYRVRVTKTNPGAGLSCIVIISTWTALAGSAVLGATLYAWGADLRVANDGVNLPVYQRVNTSTDYDTTGFPYYLRFVSDDSMATNTITPGIDKAQVFAGVRKLSDAAQAVVAEMSATIASNNGTFLLAAPDDASATFAFDSKGTTQVDAIASSLTAPLTRVVTGIGDISGDTAIIRINGVQADQETSDQGTGNYLAYPLYIGRRNNATLPLNGRIYSLITRFGANLDVVTINNTEVYVSGKMGGGYVSPIAGYDFLVDANGDQITDASDNPLFTQVLYT